MRKRTRNARRLVGFVAVVVGVSLAAPASAYHWYRDGWRDQHASYPPKPNSYSEVVDTFGQPCSDRASANSFQWKAADNGQWYTVVFHRKLGGGVSTNLDNDVRGHIGNQHLDEHVQHGIWGYACRDVRGGDTASMHAWGIAVDVSSAHDYNGRCSGAINRHHAPIWQDHRWVWGMDWCDPMHFQYGRT